MSRPIPRPAPPLTPPASCSARIVLIGPPAAGKTTVGRLLAERLDVSLRDTDAMLVAEHGAIPEFFAEHGEPAFRVAERAAVDEALRELLRRPGVVSLGAGAVMHPETRAQLRSAHFTVVLISIDEKTVAGRIGNSSRPLLNAGDRTPLQSWRELTAARMPLYEELADVTVAASASPPAHVVARIMGAVAGRPEEPENASDDGEHRARD